MQRRNSTVSEESSKRLSRTNSAQTPGSLQRQQTNPNPLDPHTEAVDEGSPVSPTVPRGTVFSQAPNTQATKPPPQRPTNIDDDDDPFSKFIGRGSIDNQSFVPKPKTTGSGKAAQTNISADPYAIPDDDEYVDPLDERDNPKRLSKKFQALTGEPQSVIEGKGEKLTTVTTGTARPSSSSSASKELGPNADGVYPNGYKFPPKHTWGEATKIGLKAFGKFTITPSDSSLSYTASTSWPGVVCYSYYLSAAENNSCATHPAHMARKIATTSTPRAASGSKSTLKSSTPFSASRASVSYPGAFATFTT